MRTLVTGGAGFIGSHLVDALLGEGHEVRVLDSLEPQVHGPSRQVPAYLNRSAELVIGDIRDREIVAKALEGVEAVFHHAAAVGVGQSMYEMERYVSANSLGTAIVLEEIVKRRADIRKIVVASSMSIYGEGAYRDADGQTLAPKHRPLAQMERHAWEVEDAQGRPLTAIPTPESKPADPTSIYAITKLDHEYLFLVTGAAYNIPAVALRYFNTYGPRQALSNPYTGLLAIVCSQLLNHNRPLIFEDGLQRRDFVHVSDIARANILALKSDIANGRAYNVGTGQAATVLEVIKLISDQLGASEAPEIVNRYRAGDIRHCFADISRISADLGFAPKMSLADGIADLMRWIRSQHSTDSVRVAIEGLKEHVLIH
ncbi:NAD-dependent epimerase/dehydratase family protein [Sphingobium nicotianae]|uniref:NAD-dependent epimerase/dehydratase family protein n=1 Tax=Sphingobium nicotianae TaxID=2782607 RepID=A0A9X1DFM6_9SPHN|nr:NAD-dependent epimerase/dehydratase family protein [Sphingobium nicotianae]MBT2189095.1 NAD-dependent epimerase/dehydratase family protein [Sphingobium nicotianae]